MIHAFGVVSEFHGMPKGTPETPSRTFASLMFSDLLLKATGYGRSLCGLLVHKDNTRAKRFYEREGFVLVEEVRGTHDRMLMELPLGA